MEKFRKENMMRICDLVQQQTGAELSGMGGKPPVLRIVVIAATVLCFLILSGFAYSKVSSLADDEVGFWAVYQGNGVFAWTWPTLSRTVATAYGERNQSGTVSDHINIAGTMNDAVYAVANGVVLSTGFDSVYGQTITLDLGDGVQVLYGHLQEIRVSAGASVDKGDVIGQLGSTGMAVGASLLFKVSIDGEAADPLEK